MDSKPGARTQQDLDVINKLAEPVVSEIGKQTVLLLKGIVDAGFTEKEAHHFAGYFLMMLAGRSAAFELQAEAFEKKIRGFSAQDLLGAIGSTQQKSIQTVCDGFLAAMEQEFGLDRKVFDAEVNQLMLERATAKIPMPPKGSKQWN